MLFFFLSNRGNRFRNAIDKAFVLFNFKFLLSSFCLKCKFFYKIKVFEGQTRNCDSFALCIAAEQSSQLHVSEAFGKAAAERTTGYLRPAIVIDLINGENNLRKLKKPTGAERPEILESCKVQFESPRTHLLTNC